MQPELAAAQAPSTPRQDRDCKKRCVQMTPRGSKPSQENQQRSAGGLKTRCQPPSSAKASSVRPWVASLNRYKRRSLPLKAGRSLTTQNKCAGRWQNKAMMLLPTMCLLILGKEANTTSSKFSATGRSQEQDTSSSIFPHDTQPASQAGIRACYPYAHYQVGPYPQATLLVPGFGYPYPPQMLPQAYPFLYLCRHPEYRYHMYLSTNDARV